MGNIARRAGVAVGGDNSGGGSVVFDAGGGAVGFVEVKQEDGIRVKSRFGIAGFQLDSGGGSVGDSVVLAVEFSRFVMGDGGVYDDGINAGRVVEPIGRSGEGELVRLRGINF